jgi:dTDP-4-amino-4,6-dideoxygalactose transaminase
VKTDTIDPQATTRTVPFFRPDIREDEVQEVVATLRSGWLTTGPRVARFERELAHAVGAPHAVALNSCTAALHLAVEALGLKPGQGVLVPTMTFAATAEVVRYLGGIPVLVDCDPVTGNMDMVDARRRLASSTLPIVGIMPVHVGGLMMDIGVVRQVARDHGLWVVEDAAHALPAAWRPSADAAWQRCGEATADVTCFSFYANKTLTTGEGGMVTTADAALADRMRLMSLHGLSHDAWGRYTKGGSWDYRILAPGFKYNLTDVAAAIGIHQLARAESMRAGREAIALEYRERLGLLDLVESFPDSLAHRAADDHTQRLHRSAQRTWRDAVGPLAAVAHAPLLRADVCARCRRLSERDRDVRPDRVAADLSHARAG